MAYFENSNDVYNWIVDGMMMPKTFQYCHKVIQMAKSETRRNGFQSMYGRKRNEVGSGVILKYEERDWQSRLKQEETGFNLCVYGKNKWAKKWSRIQRLGG